MPKLFSPQTTQTEILTNNKTTEFPQRTTKLLLKQT